MSSEVDAKTSDAIATTPGNTLRPSSAVPNRPWREPKLMQPSQKEMDSVASIVASPRFLLACQRYGVADPRSLLPRKEVHAATRSSKGAGHTADGGLEQKLLDTQEKRRLVDLGGVLMERKILMNHSRPSSRAGLNATMSSTTSTRSAATSMEYQMEAVRAQTAAWVEGEKRRTKTELISLVEVDAKRNIKRIHDRLRREANQAAELKQRVDADAKRRVMRQDYHETREAWLNRVDAAEHDRIQRVVDKMQKQMDDRERRLAERADLALQESRRRGQLEEEHARQVRARFAAQQETQEGLAGAREQRQEKALAHRLERLYRYKEPGKVTTLAESPGGVRLAKVQQKVAEENEKRRQIMLEHNEKQRLRQQANEERRMSTLEARRSATLQRFQRHQDRMTEVKQMDIKAREVAQSKIDHVVRTVETRKEQQRRWIEEQRQLSLARDEEKRQGVARAARARSFVLERLAQKQNEIDCRVATMKKHRSNLSFASRAQASEIHYVREQVKEALAVSPLESLDALRRQPSLLASLGIDVTELERASRSLSSTMSAPDLGRTASRATMRTKRAPSRKMVRTGRRKGKPRDGTISAADEDEDRQDDA